MGSTPAIPIERLLLVALLAGSGGACSSGSLGKYCEVGDEEALADATAPGGCDTVVVANTTLTNVDAIHPDFDRDLWIGPNEQMVDYKGIRQARTLRLGVPSQVTSLKIGRITFQADIGGDGLRDVTLSLPVEARPTAISVFLAGPAQGRSPLERVVIQCDSDEASPCVNVALSAVANEYVLDPRILLQRLSVTVGAPLGLDRLRVLPRPSQGLGLGAELRIDVETFWQELLASGYCGDLTACLVDDDPEGCEEVAWSAVAEAPDCPPQSIPESE